MKDRLGFTNSQNPIFSDQCIIEKYNIFIYFYFAGILF